MLTEAQLQQIRQPLATAIGLPGYAYRDPAFLAHELDRIFGRMWFSIGHGARVPAKGDVMPVQVGDTPLLIARGLDGALRVFHNVCRHRGLKLIERPQRQAHGSIVCPYHGWTYRLDGRCAAIPYWNRATGENLQPGTDAGYDLAEVRSQVWLDLIFVDLSGSAPPFEDFIAPLDQALQASKIPELACMQTWESVTPGNWKVVIENFMDPYHLSFVHPQAGSIKSAAEHQNYALTPDLWGADYLNATRTRRRLNTAAPLPDISGLSEALGPNSKAAIIFPNTLLYMYPSWIGLRTVIPLTADSCYQAHLTYISKDGEAEEFAETRRLFKEGSLVINDQDLPIISRVQATRASAVADRSRFVPDWDVRSHRFQVRVAELMAQ